MAAVGNNIAALVLLVAFCTLAFAFGSNDYVLGITIVGTVLTAAIIWVLAIAMTLLAG
jgi:hypothetical protein